jgi:hypothetical protein
MATSKQCKMPIKENKRLDHATKLEAVKPPFLDSFDVVGS